MTRKRSLIIALVLVPALVVLGTLWHAFGRVAATPETATRDMVPDSFVVMAGMTPRDEQAWKVLYGTAKPRIDTLWETDARFDEVVAFYQAKFEMDGLAVHRVDNNKGVRLYWGLLDRIRTAKPETNDFIYVSKAPQDGKTVVRVVLSVTLE